ncbi:MAG: hypothetical protein IT285_14160 [Bdellovibrionales bacterium]|nr:hypothetical protein [Bdellovibrionales bacterium]
MKKNLMSVLSLSLALAAQSANAQELVPPAQHEVPAVQSLASSMQVTHVNLLREARKTARHTYHSNLPPHVQRVLADIQNVNNGIRGVADSLAGVGPSAGNPVQAYLSLRDQMLTMEGALPTILNLPMSHDARTQAQNLRATFRDLQDYFISRWKNRAAVAQRASEAAGSARYAADRIRQAIAQPIPGTGMPAAGTERTLVVAAQLDVVRVDVDNFGIGIGYNLRNPAPLQGAMVEVRQSLELAKQLAARPGVNPAAIQELQAAEQSVIRLEHLFGLEFLP